MAVPGEVVHCSSVLVTGGCGFIGGAVVRALRRRGINVVNLDRVSYAASVAQHATPPAAAELRHGASLLGDGALTTGERHIAEGTLASASASVRHPLVGGGGGGAGGAGGGGGEDANSSASSTAMGSGDEDGLLGGYVLVRGDTCDYALVCRTLRQHAIDGVVHLAGETHVDHSFLGFETARNFVTSNVMGTQAVLEAVRAVNDAAARGVQRVTTRVQRVVVVSTDEVYGDVGAAPAAVAAGDAGTGGGAGTNGDARKWRDVGDPLFPSNPYAASKAGAEMLAGAYQRSLGVPVIVTRGTNVYGPGQFPEKVIPKFACRLLLKEALADGHSLASLLPSLPTTATRTATPTPPEEVGTVGGSGGSQRQFAADGASKAAASDDDDEAVPDVDLRLCVHGQGTAVRNYLYVDDAAEALVAVLTRGVVGETYTVSGDAASNERSTLQLARELTTAVFGGRPRATAASSQHGAVQFDWRQHVTFVTDRVFNDAWYAVTGPAAKDTTTSTTPAAADSAAPPPQGGSAPTEEENGGPRAPPSSPTPPNSLEQLGWRPQVGIENGLATTIRWFRHQLHSGTLFGLKRHPDQDPAIDSASPPACWWDAGGECVARAVLATHTFHEQPPLLPHDPELDT